MPFALASLRRRLAANRGAVVLALLIALAALFSGFAVGACRTGGLIPRAPGSGASEPEIRVRLTRSAESVRLDADGPMLLTPLSSPNAPPSRARPPILLRAEGGVMAAFEAPAPGRPQERRVAIAPAPSLAIDAEDAGAVRVDGVPHAGRLEAIARSGSERAGVDLVEAVPIERYIPGVLTGELYASWSPATYEAQAIAARSYALHERGRRMRLGDHFHVESTTQDQAYAGDRATPQAVEAARRTRGVVLTHRDRILRAYYSSTCGDRAASARDTWPTGPGFAFNLDAPIQAHERDCPCEFSPRHRWRLTRPRDALARRFARWGSENGDPIKRLRSIRTIEPLRRNLVGRPAAYAVTDRQGRAFTLSAEELRLACNTSAEGLPDIEASSRVLSGDLDLRVEGEQVVIEGRGFGHGVGMCQFGAEGLARQGWDAEAIVRHYYRGAAVERAY